MYKDGHFYSTIPNKAEIDQWLRGIDRYHPYIDLSWEGQYRTACKYSKYYNSPQFKRYTPNNEHFPYIDAAVLQAFLLSETPQKIVEVGGGFSTGVIIDSVGYECDVTVIEPHPKRLRQVLTGHDIRNIHLVNDKLQNVEPATIIDADFLFVDSSHVVKCGSDIQYLFYKIIPLMKNGAFVHFHDIRYPFEYPAEWLEIGRFWNEAYFVYMFLMFNSCWKVHMFNSYMIKMFKNVMPKSEDDRCGSLYIKRTK